ncbi:MAG: class I SAM-dependent methyltransferase [Candidatus Daviesbacteria bacterium]|nr:class I SAM-dependent methyltransferase [Candidatus Daviesbacteria bacterium]
MCKGRSLKRIISLSPTPPANAFLTKTDLKKNESFFPLQVNFCIDCGQLQLTHVVSPELLFRNYVYVSSTSAVFVTHFEEYAGDLIKRFKLNKKSLVVDIGSNDGILLRPLKKAGIKILGVDPAIKIAKKATNSGLQTLPFFLNTKVAKNIVDKFGQADVVTANNAFAHIHDLDEIIESVKILTKDDGVFVIEFPYLIDFIKKNLFDTIYHEHLSYLSVRSLSAIFKRLNMEIFDAKKVSSHGGSLRIYGKKMGAKYKVKKAVQKFLDEEKNLGLNETKTYLDFAKAIKNNRRELTVLLKKLKSQGKTIVGYGAPAKGNTLLNFYKIGPQILDYIVDDSAYKQGLYTPGTHIPVFPFNKISETKPDYIFILAWNFANPIMDKLSSFKINGGRFIIPVPKAKII